MYVNTYMIMIQIIRPQHNSTLAALAVPLQTLTRWLLILFIRYKLCHNINLTITLPSLTSGELIITVLEQR